MKSPILNGALAASLGLLLAACEGCAVLSAARGIDRAAHRLVEDYCALGEPERRLFRKRWNASSRHRVTITCEGDRTP